jgi:hypothetical protein
MITEKTGLRVAPGTYDYRRDELREPRGNLK